MDNRRVSFQNPLDRRELRTVRWKKQEFQVGSMLAQERGQDHSLMIASVVEHDDDATASCSMLQQLRQETLEGFGIKHLADSAHELTCAQIDGAKASDGLAVGACSKIGSLSSGGTHMRQREPCC